MDKLEQAARRTFKLSGDEAEEQTQRYEKAFKLALRRHPTFYLQHLAKGDAWMRRHYTYQDLQALTRLRPL